MSAIVAKVMNSTVGTSAVKALDTILKESDAANVEKLNTYMTTIANNAADRLYNKLKSDVRLVGSDEVLLAYDGTWYIDDDDHIVRTNMGVTFNHSGTVIAKTLQVSDESNDLRVYKGSISSSNIIAEESNWKTSSENRYDIEISVSFNVEVGQVYYFEIEGDLNPSRRLDICGSMAQFSPTVTIS